MPWCANVPVFLDSPPPFILTLIRGHSFHFALSLFSSPCLCQNTKDILIFAFILTHISFSPGVCHKQKHYFQRQDKTIVSAIEISQVCYNTCSCKNEMQNWQTMCFSVSMVGIFIYFRFYHCCDDSRFTHFCHPSFFILLSDFFFLFL